MTPRFIVRNESGKRAVLRVIGVIDDYFDGETFNMTDSEKELIRELQMIPDDRGIDLHVNSSGGKVGLALGMHNALKSVQDRLRVINTGNMLSSATLLCPPKAKLLMTRGSVAMVHKPLLEPNQPMNANDMRQAIECLDANEKAMAEIYSDRTGKSMKAAREWMEGPTGAGTWMTGTEAMEHGFGDGDYDDDDDEDFGPGGDTRGMSLAVVAQFGASIPEKYKQMILAAGDRDHQQGKSNKAQGTPADSLSHQGGGNPAGKPPQVTNKNKGNQMTKLVHTLVAAGFQLPADASEDQINLIVESIISAKTELATENSGLKTQAEADRKAAIEAHVKTKTWLSPELQAKWVDAIVKDEAAKALLDAMQAPEAKPTGKAPRGAAPPPPEAKDEGKTNEEKLAEVREQLKTEADPAKRAILARQARVLRGHADIVTATATAPMYALMDGKFVQVTQQ